MEYVSRLNRLRQSLAARKIDALLVSQPENRRYLSGYTACDHGIAETSGLLLIPRQGTPYLLTDFRFREQADNDTEHFEILLYPKGVLPLLRKLCYDLDINRLGFESHYTLHSTAEKLQELGKRLSVEVLPLSGIVERLRVIKDENELALIRRSVQLNEKVFQEVFASLDDKATEVDIALEIATRMRKAGAESESFETIVAAGAASSLPHSVPGSGKLIADGPLLIDMGLILDGYCSDMTRSFCLGRANEDYRKIHRLVRQAMLQGIDAVKAGVTCREVDQAARRVIEDAGYGKYFGHALGHGVGLAVHEEPRISPKSRRKLRSGMIITIEPGIYIPGWGGVRLENMVAVTDDGYEVLNHDTTLLDL
ncbi:MAG: Xaa-Pro peptidase family protein [Desulfocapsaceae bacterium]|nr:Xaa-Pro peptidase family protein [Desulfocapsaceae bacterium]